MSTYIKTGYWEINKERKLGWLDLDALILKVTGGGGGAPLDSPAFTGVPTAPTAPLGTNTTQIATTEFVLANSSSSPIVLKATNSLFSLTPLAGAGVTTLNNSIVLGLNAGDNATNANESNFLGRNSGRFATNAGNSNFIGNFAGFNATNANNSNFLGNQAGNAASGANNSNFLGAGAGNGATGASYSNFFGFQAGKTFAGNNLGSNNIIIGTNISLPNATTNSINIGGVLFGVNTHSTTTGDPSIVAQPNGRIGIGVVTPTAVLHLGPSATGQAMMRLTVGAPPTSPNDGDVWLESNTDTGLKIRINGITKTISLV